MERHNGIEFDPEGAFVYWDEAQRALDAEREKVKRLSTCGTDHSTPWWQVKCEDLEAQLATLQARNKELNRTLADVYQQRDGLQAQLRQLEGQSKQQAEEAVIVFAKYTTLRQLVESFRSSEEWGAVKAWMVEGAPTRQEGVEAAKRITKAQYEMENALVGCRQALAAQDAGKEVASG